MEKTKLKAVGSVCTNTLKGMRQYYNTLPEEKRDGKTSDDLFMEHVGRRLNLDYEVMDTISKKFFLDGILELMETCDEVRTETNIFGYKEPTKTEK